LAAIVIQLLGDKDERLVASQIHKLLKSSSLPSAASGTDTQFPQRRGRNFGPSGWGRGNVEGRRGHRTPARGKCFSCKRPGHFIRDCPERRH
jgi:hypothetical protein